MLDVEKNTLFPDQEIPKLVELNFSAQWSFLAPVQAEGLRRDPSGMEHKVCHFDYVWTAVSVEQTGSVSHC